MKKPHTRPRFQDQQTSTYFCQTPGGLETLAAGELEGLGCSAVKKAHRGLYFKADQGTLYAVNYQARLITRVLAPLASFAIIRMCPRASSSSKAV